DGNAYDENPPCRPEQGPDQPRGPVASKRTECVAWLQVYLAGGAKKVIQLRDDAEAATFTAGTLYRAKADLNVHEFGRQEGAKTFLWWSLPQPAEGGANETD